MENNLSRLHIPRQNEIQYLINFIQRDERFGLMSVRGRRRTGKTWILSQIEAKLPEQVIKFEGKLHQKTKDGLKKFGTMLIKFAQKNDLVTEAMKEEKKIWSDWDDVFDTLADLSIKYFQQNDKPLCLILDEVQWIKNQGVNVIASIKSKAFRLNQSCLKIILCGSSMKFFKEQVDSNQGTLFQMETYFHLKVKSLSLAQIQRECFPQWTAEQNALVYMITGGLPVYLEKIHNNEFYYSINKAFFCENSIFLQDLSELLLLEFGKGKSKSALNILEAMKSGQGMTKKTLQQQTKFSKSYVHGIVEDLVYYGFLEKVNKIVENNESEEFLLKETFLIFYFNVFKPNMELVKGNVKGNIFQRCFFGNDYCLPNFTGVGFEILCRKSLIDDFRYSIGLFDKLGIDTVILEEKVTTAKRKKQIDILYEENQGKRQRNFIIECKWGNESLLWIEELKAKKIDEQSILVLISKNLFSKKFKEQAGKEIVMITLNDLI